jgi:putative MATE family efflux protein
MANDKEKGHTGTMKQKHYEIDMCNGPIMSRLIAFFVPLMISGTLQLLFNAVDIVVVGRFTGSQALAAVGSTTSLINMFTNLFIGISLGVNVMTARYYAAGRDQEVSDTVHTAVTTALISGILMLFAGLFLSRTALTMMDTPEDVIDQSVLYMRLYFLGMPFFMTYNYGAAILRAVGDTKRPLIFLMIAGILNAILNMILVIVFHLGVAGVAIATAFSQFVSCILVLNCLIRSETSYRLDFRKLCIKPQYLLHIFQVGIPAGIQTTLISFSNVLLQSSVNSFGAIAMAGYTAANNMLAFLYQCINSITQACMSFTSQNMGVKKTDRMDRVLIECLILEVFVGIVFGNGIRYFAPEILQLYTTSPDVIASGVEILAITAPPYLLCGIMDLFPGAMRGMGYSAVPMVLSLIGTIGMRLIWIFGVFPTHRTLFCLFISYPASWGATIVLQVICFYFVRKKIHQKLNAGIAAR